MSGGTVTAEDVTFPGLSAFDTLTSSVPFQTSNWTVAAENSSMDFLILDFTTTKTPGSLVDFTGGTIFGLLVSDIPSGAPLYINLAGNIAPLAVPEPSSLALVLVGIGALAFVVSRRRMSCGHRAVDPM